jgi:hypothetical protein
VNSSIKETLQVKGLMSQEKNTNLKTIPFTLQMSSTIIQASTTALSPPTVTTMTFKAHLPKESKLIIPLTVRKQPVVKKQSLDKGLSGIYSTCKTARILST